MFQIAMNITSMFNPQTGQLGVRRRRANRGRTAGATAAGGERECRARNAPTTAAVWRLMTMRTHTHTQHDTNRHISYTSHAHRHRSLTSLMIICTVFIGWIIRYARRKLCDYLYNTVQRINRLYLSTKMHHNCRTKLHSFITT